MKRGLVLFLSLVVLTVCCFSVSAFAVEGQTEKQFDALQALFLSLDSKTSQSSVEKYVAENNLFMSSGNGNMSRVTVLKIAFSEDVAKRSHPQPGDYISIEFDRERDQHITYALYFNYNSWRVDGFNSIDPVGQEYEAEVYFDMDDYYFTGSNKSFYEEGAYYTKRNIPRDLKRTTEEEHALKYTKYENAEGALQALLTLLGQE